jgi:hypothetical protein
MRESAAVTLLLMDACTPRSADPPPGHVVLAPGLTLIMPSPASLNRRIEAQQLVIARYATGSIEFEARISATPDRFEVVCLDPLGREASRIRWTPTSVVAEKARWISQDLHPDNMLANIIMVFWPAAVVRQSLAMSGGTLEADTTRRCVRRRGADVIRADFQPLPGGDPWNGNVHYRNLPWNYALDIQSRVVGP